MGGSLVYRNSYHPFSFQMAKRFLMDGDVQDLKNLKRHHGKGILDETEFKASLAVVLEAEKEEGALSS